MNELNLAQSERIDRYIDLQLAEVLDLGAKDVGPEARHKLRGLLKYYAKKPHPFRACVRDNRKRFGPGRTEAICATLKDIIRGTTHWRGHPEKDKGAAGIKNLSEAFTFLDETITADDLEGLEIDDELASILEDIAEPLTQLLQKLREHGVNDHSHPAIEPDITDDEQDDADLSASSENTDSSEKNTDKEGAAA